MFYLSFVLHVRASEIKLKQNFVCLCFSSCGQHCATVVMGYVSGDSSTHTYMNISRQYVSVIIVYIITECDACPTVHVLSTSTSNKYPHEDHYITPVNHTLATGNHTQFLCNRPIFHTYGSGVKPHPPAVFSFFSMADPWERQSPLPKRSGGKIFHSFYFGTIICAIEKKQVHYFNGHFPPC